jgi:nucleotide-binding universal stress UspA family protein
VNVFERILVAVDFSEFSRQALHLAAALGRAFSSQVLVVHVCNLPRVVDPATLAGQQRAIKALLNLQREFGDSAAVKLEEWIAAEDWGQAEVTREITSGVPYRVITRLARSFEADVVIMGSYGRSGFARMLIGSTTEKVLRKCPVPVLAVNQPSRRSSPGRKKPPTVS